MTQKTDDIITRLNALSGVIDAAQEKLQNQQVVNLSHLDAEVEQVCQEALSLPPPEAQKVQPAMAKMIEKLEVLGQSLKDFQTDLQNRINQDKDQNQE